MALLYLHIDVCSFQILYFIVALSVVCCLMCDHILVSSASISSLLTKSFIVVMDLHSNPQYVTQFMERTKANPNGTRHEQKKPVVDRTHIEKTC